MITAPINKIIPFSVVDGKGNRTSIFLQGCNIRCKYCHNPETQNLCGSCGTCVPKCPVSALSFQNEKVVWDMNKCIHCDTCIQVCERNATPKIKEMSVDEVFEKIKNNVPFIRGITVSGGECTLYPQFLTELFTKVKEIGLTCFIDTNGTIELEQEQALMSVCDGVMLDVKSWEEQCFYNLTGYSNENVKKNLVYLAKEHKIEELRIVCLEQEVDAKKVLTECAKLLGKEKERLLLKLIKFRNYGVKGEFQEKTSPSDQYMEELERLAKELGFQNILLT